MQERFDSEETKREFLANLTPDQRHYRMHGYLIKERFIDFGIIDELNSLRDSLNFDDRQSFPVQHQSRCDKYSQ